MNQHVRYALLFFLSSFALLAQPDVSGITQPAGGTNPTIVIANEAGTGTTVNTITTLTGAPSTAIISTAAATGKFVGICSSGCGTTGSATITLMGRIGCAFDGATRPTITYSNRPRLTGNARTPERLIRPRGKPWDA